MDTNNPGLPLIYDTIFPPTFNANLFSVNPWFTECQQLATGIQRAIEAGGGSTTYCIYSKEQPKLDDAGRISKVDADIQRQRWQHAEEIAAILSDVLINRGFTVTTEWDNSDCSLVIHC